MGHQGQRDRDTEVADILLSLNDASQRVSMPSTSQGSGSQNTVTRLRGDFQYGIKWDEVPLQTLKNLTDANSALTPAHPKDIDALKKYLMKDLFYAYEQFKQMHIVTTKTPGSNIYQSVAKQVAEKFKNCFKVEANGEIIENDLYWSFLSSLTHSMENQGRRVPKVSGSATASLAKGQVGVVEVNYNPPMTEDTIMGQTDAKSELQQMYSTVRERNYNIQEITKLMHWSFNLQRRDIVASIQKLKGNETTEEDATDDIETDSEILKLQREWPFLFKLRWQGDHFLKLTGSVVEMALHDYINGHLDTLILYLCSTNTEAAIKNIATRTLWEKHGKDSDIKFLVAIMMIANHFHEDYNLFIKTSEKTTYHLDVKAKVPDLDGSPSIIALDTNIYMANRFFSCIDREVIITATTSQEALLGIIQGAFIFDAHYHPNLPHTFEFIERVICRLGSDKTMRLTKQVRVASLTVLKLVNNAAKFKERLEKYL